MKIGILAERKKPEDNRVALSPKDAKCLQEIYPQLEILVESSPHRVFEDSAYQNEGFPLVERATEADLLLGVKEVPLEELIPNKAYFFFSHTIKKQPYNKVLLRSIVEKNITLLDYECLVDKAGNRVIGFGKWAGIVGTYNAFRTYHQKNRWHPLIPAHQLPDYQALLGQLKHMELPKIKIAYTGTGKVSDGIREILEYLKIKEVMPQEFKHSRGPVFTQLKNEHLYQRKDQVAFEKQHFFKNHKAYSSIFLPYLHQADVLINGMYWENDMEPLFSINDLSEEVQIRTIADITCDVKGSIPITWKATNIEDPVVGWDLKKQEPSEAFKQNTIDIMAVTNLPSELPKSSSEDFSEKMKEIIVPEWMKNSPMIQNATLVEKGKITAKYAYLDSWLHE